MTEILNAIAEPRRQQILQLLWERELSAGEIHRSVGAVTFGAVSQHLKVLSDRGVVAVRREGRRRYYRVRREALGPLATWLDQMWAEKLAQLRDLAEIEQAAKAAAGD